MRVRASVNGEVQDLQLCDQHYQETLRRQGRSASPLESLFGRRSLFDEFFGDSGMGSLFGDSPLRGGGFPDGGDISDMTVGDQPIRRHEGSAQIDKTARRQHVMYYPSVLVCSGFCSQMLLG